MRKGGLPAGIDNFQKSGWVEEERDGRRDREGRGPKEVFGV